MRGIIQHDDRKEDTGEQAAHSKKHAFNTGCRRRRHGVRHGLRHTGTPVPENTPGTGHDYMYVNAFVDPDIRQRQGETRT
jgi:hypothetical protein